MPDEKAPAASPADEPAVAAEAAPPIDPAVAFTTELKAALALIDRYVSSREVRFAMSSLRMLAALRKKVKEVGGVGWVSTAVSVHLGANHTLGSGLVQLLATLPQGPTAMEADDAVDKKPTGTKRSLLPEAETYVALLALLCIIDLGSAEQATTFAAALLARLGAWNRRTLDPIAEKVYFYVSWAHERAGCLDRVRSMFLAAQRTACLHHNLPCQAALLNLLLRNYLHYKLFDQADKLLAKSVFPDQASNAQLARFLYYTGRIKAMQLEYSEAHRCLLQAQRKAPQSSALGFRVAAHRLGTVVQLLLGEIPDRAFFRAKQSQGPMKPYLKLVQAVRLGNLGAFRAAMEAHADVFHADGNFTLIVRLRQNVIRAGLRNIALAYTRISLADCAAKLKLDNPADMESIAAKAIRDGVIDATIDHAAGVLEARAAHDVYSTLEPQAAYHKRITFCLNLHNDALKAMSYPPDAHRGELPDADAIKERQREEQELAQSIAEEEDDDF